MSVEPRRESPIEEQLFHQLLKTGAHCKPQHEIETPVATFRADFLLERDDYRVCVECDGRGFHNDYQRDEYRDVLLLGSGIDAVYRFDGSVVHRAAPYCALAIAVLTPRVFSKESRGQILGRGDHHNIDHYRFPIESLRSAAALAAHEGYFLHFTDLIADGWEEVEGYDEEEDGRSERRVVDFRCTFKPAASRGWKKRPTVWNFHEFVVRPENRGLSFASARTLYDRERIANDPDYGGCGCYLPMGHQDECPEGKK